MNTRGQKTEGRGRSPERKPDFRGQMTEARVLVGRLGLALALGVSLRTVDRMLACGDIVPVRLRGLVRFYVPDVVRALSESSDVRKHGRKAVDGGTVGCAPVGCGTVVGGTVEGRKERV